MSEKVTRCVTMGQSHFHRMGGKGVVDKDVVVKITRPTTGSVIRAVKDLFGEEYSMIYTPEEMEGNFKYYPRGVVGL